MLKTKSLPIKYVIWKRITSFKKKVASSYKMFLKFTADLNQLTMFQQHILST